LAADRKLETVRWNRVESKISRLLTGSGIEVSLWPILAVGCSLSRNKRPINICLSTAKHVSTGPSRHAPQRPLLVAQSRQNQVKDDGKLATTFNCRPLPRLWASVWRAAIAPWPKSLSPFSRFLGHPLPSAASTASPCTFHGLNGRLSSTLASRQPLINVSRRHRRCVPDEITKQGQSPAHSSTASSVLDLTNKRSVTFLPGRLYCPIADGER
jgi:hypothetical protein